MRKTFRIYSFSNSQTYYTVVTMLYIISSVIIYLISGSLYLLYFFLMISDVDHIFMDFWPFVCLWKNLYSSPLPIFHWFCFLLLFCFVVSNFLLLSCMKFLICIFNINPFQMYDLQLFSPHLLILLVVALTVQSFLVWCSSSCLLCFCCMWFSFHKQKIIPKTHAKRFFPIISTRIFTVSYSHHAKKKRLFDQLSLYI